MKLEDGASEGTARSNLTVLWRVNGAECREGAQQTLQAMEITREHHESKLQRICLSPGAHVLCLICTCACVCGA